MSMEIIYRLKRLCRVKVNKKFALVLKAFLCIAEIKAGEINNGHKSLEFVL